jgi:hypothetical protein
MTTLSILFIGVIIVLIGIIFTSDNRDDDDHWQLMT